VTVVFMLWYVFWEPATEVSDYIRSDRPQLVVLAVSIAALGGVTPVLIWRHGLRAAAVASGIFWTCAFWLLLANSTYGGRAGVGFLHSWIG
jgi:hypothetical protein